MIPMRPPRGAQINWSENLSRNLITCVPFNEFGGDNVYDVAGRSVFSPESSPGTWGGGGYVNDANGEALEGCANPLQANDLWTLAIDVTLTDVSTRDGVLFSGLQGGSPGWMIREVGGVCRAYTVTTQINSGTLAAGNRYLIHMVKARNTVLELYINGKYVDNSTVGSEINATSTGNVIIGNGDGFSLNQEGIYYGAWIWRRTLTSEEVHRHYLNPWEMFDSHRPRIWTASAGGTITGTGAISATVPTLSGSGSVIAASSTTQIITGNVFNGSLSANTGAVITATPIGYNQIIDTVLLDSQTLTDTTAAGAFSLTLARGGTFRITGRYNGNLFLSVIITITDNASVDLSSYLSALSSSENTQTLSGTVSSGGMSGTTGAVITATPIGYNNVIGTKIIDGESISAKTTAGAFSITLARGGIFRITGRYESDLFLSKTITVSSASSADISSY